MSQVPSHQSLIVPPDQPLDTIVANLMQTIARKGRGFVLGHYPTTDGRIIEVKESPKPLELHDEYVPPAGLRNHQIHDTDSFIKYVQKYGDETDSLVFYNQDGAAVILYEYERMIEGRAGQDSSEPKDGNLTEARGRRETAVMAFRASDDWKAWTDALNVAMDHKRLLSFLLAHEHNLSQPDILSTLGSIKATSTVNFESDIQELGKEVGMMFKSQAGEELKRFPKTLAIVVPVLESDVTEADRIQAAEIRLNVQMPGGPTEKPLFTLTCSKWRQFFIARVKVEGQKIADELGEEWTVLHGEHRYLPAPAPVTDSWADSKPDEDDDD